MENHAEIARDDERKSTQETKGVIQLKSITLKLPFPPTINDYYGQSQRGGKYLKPKGKAFRQEVIWKHHAEEPIFTTERIKMNVIFHYNQNRNYDLDNRMKALQDSLQVGKENNRGAGIYQDDSQIDELVATRGNVIKDDPHCIVIIEEIL